MSTSTIQSAEVPDQSEEIMDLLKSQLAALDEQVKKMEKNGLFSSSPALAVNADKIKKEINAALSASPNGITKEYLEERLNSINTNLLNKINNLSVQSSNQNSAAFQAISLTNKIDNLSGTRLSNITVSGVTGLADADIPDTITASSYLPLSGGTLTGSVFGASASFSGQLTVSGAATSTLAGDTNFDSGTLYIDSLNNRVGIASSSPSETLSVNGATYFSQISAPSVTTDRLYNSSGDLYWNGNLVGSASVGNWTSLDGNVYRSSGNVGIGTTSPYARLSVVGETVSSYFTATTTTASTFPYASSTALTVSGSAYLTGLGQGWLHTAGGTNALSASTSPTVNYLTATSTTATSTFAGGVNVAGSSGLTVLQNGNVGVGTVAPSQKLDIEKGHIRLGQVAAPTAPTVAINATAGNLNGAYYYRVTYVTALGETETGVVSDVVSPVNQQVDLSAIPVSSDSAVTARKIYRTTAGGSNILMKLVTTINNNTATTYTDNIADDSLGVSESRVNTTGGIIYNNSARVGIADSASTAWGRNALRDNTGHLNTAIGVEALRFNTTGNYNSAVGAYALYSNTTGISNLAMGTGALYFNTTGNYNLALGSDALYSNTTGYNNSAVGMNALRLNTTGYYNSAVGMDALGFNTTGYQNSAVGNSALGFNTTGIQNTAIGYQSLYSNTTGTENTAVGYQALRANTTGIQNTAIGDTSLRSNTTGNYNVANGMYSLYTNITGSQNNAYGYNSLGANSAGLNNTAYGHQSLSENIASNNTAYGFRSLRYTTSGTGNIGLGHLSGTGIDTAAAANQRSVIDDYMTFIGYQASRDSAIASTTALTNGTAIGKNAKVAQSNAIVLGGTGSDAVSVAIGTTSPWAKLSILNTYGSQTPLFDIASSTSAAYATSSIFRINANGNVGIGTTSPWRTLSVTGTVGFSSTLSATTTNAYDLCIDAATFEVTQRTTDCSGASSLRYKQNVEKLSYGLNDLMKLNPVSFQYTEAFAPTDRKRKIGFIAEEVAPLIPEVVAYDDLGRPDSIDYPKMTSLLAKAIQELNIKVIDLEVSAASSSGNGTDGLFSWILGKFSAIGIIFSQDKIGAKNLCAKKSDGGEVCLDGDQLQSLLEKSGIAQTASSNSNSSSVSSSSSSESSSQNLSDGEASLPTGQASSSSESSSSISEQSSSSLPAEEAGSSSSNLSSDISSNSSSVETVSSSSSTKWIIEEQ